MSVFRVPGCRYNTTCNFTPVNVPARCITSGSGGQTCTPGTSVMQIQTLAPSPGPTASNAGDGGMGRYAFIFPALFGLAGLGARKRRAWRNLALGVLAFAGAMGMTACSQRYNYLNHGPPGNPGTPTGNYTITVQAQSSTGSQTTTPPDPAADNAHDHGRQKLASCRLQSPQYGLAWMLQVRRAVAAEALARFGRGKSELRRAVCRITSGI